MYNSQFSMYNLGDMVMEPEPRKYDLEDRLVEFAGKVIDTVEKMPKNLAARHLAGQLVRSGTAPALNYAEAIGAESKADFIHKMGIVLKELRETRVCLRIIGRQKYLDDSLIEVILNECAQLVYIISKSIKTAKENLRQSAPPK